MLPIAHQILRFRVRTCDKHLHCYSLGQIGSIAADSRQNIESAVVSAGM